MSFLNLSLGEFLTLFTALSSATVLLYLLDRSRRRQVVSTLRFWAPAGQPVSTQRKRRLQQPWSLLLQLLSLTLLLLAIAQVRWGGNENAVRHHVLLLDASSAAALRTPQSTVLEAAKRQVQRYLDGVPRQDRVMLVRVDALATPLTAFEEDRERLRSALEAVQPGSTGLRLEQALRFADQMLRRYATGRGEIVYAGSLRMPSTAIEEISALPARLRVLPVEAPVANVGLRRVGVRHSADPAVWDVLVTVQNDGPAPVRVPVVLRFGSAVVAGREEVLPPRQPRELAFTVRTQAAGLLTAQVITPQDGSLGDNTATLELPRQDDRTIVVYSEQPEIWRPLFAAVPQVRPEFRQPSQFQADSKGNAGSKVSMVLLDRFVPASAPQQASIWVYPQGGRPPVPVRSNVDKGVLTEWKADHPLAMGLHTRHLAVEGMLTFAPQPGDAVIARSTAGAVVVAREAAGQPKQVLIGFHPMQGTLRYNLATPLLFANTLRWLEPQLFHSAELRAVSAGSVDLDLPSSPSNAASGEDEIQVLTSAGQTLPYTLQGNRMRFFAATPGVVRVTANGREYVTSISLPEAADTAWTPPAIVLRGVPSGRRQSPVAQEWWPWLALLGALGLALEWTLFGRGSFRFSRPALLRWKDNASVPVRKAS